MCRLLTIVNHNPKNVPVINQIIGANLEEMSKQEDGYSVSDGRGGFTYMGKTAYRPANVIKNTLYSGKSPYHFIHFRKSTAGDRTTTKGLHLQWLMNRFTFAHNGTISDFSSVKDYSDSYYWFKHYLMSFQKVVDYSTCLQYLSSKSLVGAAMLYDRRDDKLHLIIRKECPIIFLPDCIVFATFDISMVYKKKKYADILGFTYAEDDETIDIPHIGQQKFDDVFLSMKKGILVEEGDISWNACRDVKIPDDRKKAIDRIRAKITLPLYPPA